MTTPQAVPIKYLGHKEVKTDNVAKSGVVWYGHGDVQKVTPVQASLLLQHQHVWERAGPAANDGGQGKDAPAPTSKGVTRELSAEVSVLMESKYLAVKAGIRKLSDDQLQEFAVSEEREKRRAGFLKLIAEEKKRRSDAG